MSRLGNEPARGHRRKAALPLRQHRERAGVALEEVSRVTRISKRFLEAIEAGDYHLLPGGVFTASYIRQYAELTGYDAEEILRAAAGELPEKIQPGSERESEGEAPVQRWARALFFG